jgi:hypothetical protein
MNTEVSIAPKQHHTNVEVERGVVGSAVPAVP